MSEVETRPKPKKRGREKPVPAITPDHGTPELRQHHEVTEVPTEVAGVTAARVDDQMLIDRYLRRGLLGQREWAAASRFFATWRAANPPQSVTGSYRPRVESGHRSVEGAVAAQQEYQAAIQAVGIQLSGVLVHVVICDQPATEWARSAGRRTTQGMKALKEALDRLAAHYGMG